MTITKNLVTKEFFKAVMSYNIEKVFELIRTNNLDVNETLNKENFSRTALHEAAAMGYTELVRELVEDAADINLSDDTGDLPIHTAIESFHYVVVEYLLKHKSKGKKDVEDFLSKYKPSLQQQKQC